ncbi:glycosyltransferase [Defluviimonas sp. WL0002]|uniref:Glycosyltransferase n=1 Tax=Albidovulum marisflavi TaxID=2984159 RepID=A0ABT2Z9R5_9RHOB|nr:glycosyltransferase [Defluviimonas sp. WL0002]MCV2867812.1 glycosyltransferase [Defluviimonas sp. WL0002]
MTSTESIESGAGQPTVAAVVIGRNEGARLVACLASVSTNVSRFVYVDSGSTDGSVSEARRAGALVVELDMSRPFTAARARNAGLAALGPGVDLVQFVDGDCRLASGWIDRAVGFFAATPEAVAVCGRLHEIDVEASIYNRLCDWEWDTPVGRAEACGGIAMMRARSLAAVGGFREDLIAGEEPDLCQRLISEGGEIWRIDAPMGFHDAAIHRFGQWWRRNVRAGHAFAQVGGLHPGLYSAARRRMVFWGAVLPVAAMAGALWLPPVVLLVAALYAASWGRATLRFARIGYAPVNAFKAGLLLTLSKFCNLQGALTYHLRRLRGKTSRIMEYK